MTTTKAKPYFTSNGGEVACEKHLGYSATAALQANPKARTIVGACDTWFRMTKPELTEWLNYLADYGYTEACEACRNGI